jgi:arabinogalactan endo-1,4-beta-galactosidase
VEAAGDHIRAADVSDLLRVEATGYTTYNSDSTSEDMLTTLQQAGLNTLRLSLRHNNPDNRNSWQEMLELAERAREMGFDIWVCPHFSDTWADPGAQQSPAAWQGLSPNELIDSVRAYTARIMQQFQPDYLQIGNEINPGFLWPQGHIDNMGFFHTLLQASISEARNQDPNCQLMLHYAGLDGAPQFFQQVDSLDYDIIAISLYPWWHGKDLASWRRELGSLHLTYNRPTLIAETAYPFTLGWNDWTHNAVGEQHQLIAGIPASTEGQRLYAQSIKEMVEETPGCLGWTWWGAELVAFDGPQSAEGSGWENCALWNFNGVALPALYTWGSEP